MAAEADDAARNNGVRGATFTTYDAQCSPLAGELAAAGVCVRPLEPGDLPQVRSVYASGMRTHIADMPAGSPLRAFVSEYIDAALATEMGSWEALTAVYSKQGSDFFVAVGAEGDVRGTVALERLNDAQCELRRMSVAPSCQRRGIG